MRRYRRRYPFSSNPFKEETEKEKEAGVIFWADLFDNVLNMLVDQQERFDLEHPFADCTDFNFFTNNKNIYVIEIPIPGQSPATIDENVKVEITHEKCTITINYEDYLEGFLNAMSEIESQTPPENNEKDTIRLGSSKDVTDIPNSDKTYYVHGFQKRKHRLYTIHFPEKIDVDTAKTHYNDGLLTITVNIYSPLYQDKKRNLVIKPDENSQNYCQASVSVTGQFCGGNDLLVGENDLGKYCSFPLRVEKLKKGVPWTSYFYVKVWGDDLVTLLQQLENKTFIKVVGDLEVYRNTTYIQAKTIVPVCKD